MRKNKHPPFVPRYPKIALFAIFIFTFCDSINAKISALPKDLSTIVESSGIPLDAISIVVQSVAENDPLVSINADVSRAPASLIKVVPTWVALETLGPSFKWRTEIYTLGPIRNGALEGDLLIKGYGDPYLVVEDLWHIVGELSRKGLRHVNGDLIVDSSYFSSDLSNVSSIDGGQDRLYNVPPNASMVNFKWINFVINPSSDGERTRITTVPQLPNLRILNSVEVSNKPCRGNNPNIKFNYFKKNKQDIVEISGSLPKSCRNYTLSRTALSPEAYLYGLFKLLINQWGGSISGNYVKAKHDPFMERKLFHQWNSKSLAEIVLRLNKWSNNLMARSLVYTIGAEILGPPGTRKKGIKFIGKYLSDRNIDIKQLHIENGSGLSRSTRVTTNLINDVLRKAWRSQIMPEFISSLSIAGEDGTTRKRFRGSKTENRIRVKTGTLKNVSSVGGYVFGKSGKVFSVVFIANHPNVDRASGPNFQEALMTWVSEL